MSTTKSPLLSIVTVVYNARDYLDITLNSVRSQTYKNFEYLIVDGGSTDGTLDLIKENDTAITTWISEPDNGIFDAMNKALHLCKGQYVCFLNAADTFYEDTTLESVAREIEETGLLDFYYGDELIVAEDGTPKKLRKARIDGEKLGFEIPHQSTFVKVSVHKNYPFDTSYTIAADRILYAELFLHNHSHHYLSVPVAQFMDGGASSDRKLRRKENYRYLKRYYGTVAVIKSKLNYGLRISFWKKVIAHLLGKGKHHGK